MFMVTFRHGEDVDKNVSNSDLNSDGFITLLSDSKFDKKKDFKSGSVCANFLFAFLSHLGITQNKKGNLASSHNSNGLGLWNQI